MKRETFAVKIQMLDFVEEKLPITKLVSLGEHLSWNEAVELRKQNPKSYTHPKNSVYQNSAENLKVFIPEIVVKQPSVKKKRVRSK